MIGRWFKRTGKRDEIFLASKFGIMMEGRDFKGIDSSGEYCKKACAQSLEKLGVDCIDLCKSTLCSETYKPTGCKTRMENRWQSCWFDLLKHARTHLMALYTLLIFYRLCAPSSSQHTR